MKAASMKKTASSNPLLKANYLNKVFFWWLRDFIRNGKEHDFNADDLYDTIPQDLSEPLTYILESNWINEMAQARKLNKKPSLWKTFIKTYGWDFMKYATLTICYTTIQIVHPQLLNLIILYFQPRSSITVQRVYFYASTYIFLIMLRAILLFHSLFNLDRLGMRARIACTSLIYKKLIRLPTSANYTSDSSVISLLSVDVTKFEKLFTYAPFIFIVPVHLIIGTYLIAQYVGITAAAVGITSLILQTIPIQALFCKITLKYRAKQATRTDDRISLMSEIFSGIRAVKMYVWEKPLKTLVFIARDFEIANYLKIAYLTAIIVSINSFSYRLSVFATSLTHHALQYGLLNPVKILPVMQHLIIMRSGVGFYFFLGLKNIIDMCVSMKRIEEFLLLEEVRFKVEHAKETANDLVSLENVTAFWDENSMIFKEVSLDFAAKKLYAVVGTVGSGKSSLLQLILGELPTASGNVIVRGRVSYASQEPWLFNCSIRENILFGEVYDGEKYDKTVSACELVDDFRQLPYGDRTLVGERGSNLSGGQRARVNLARAVYREADIYLLDDPLSAVDARVGQQIMKNCINGVLRDKTRILITHGIQQLNEVFEIILLEHGKVEFKGKMEDFCRNDQLDLSEENEPNFSTDKPISIKKSTSSEYENNPKHTEELITKGAMKISVYLSYIKAGGWNWLSLVILTNGLFVIAVSIFDFKLGTWRNAKNIFSKNGSENNIIMYPGDNLNSQSSYVDEYALIFGSLISFIIFMTIFKSIFLSKLALDASKKIHNDILSQLMTTTLRFFETNSTGKILNCFSEDTGIIDNALPQMLCIAITALFNIIAVAVSTFIANWWIVIPSSIFAFITVLIGKVYARIMQNIKRLSGNARSPILSFAASSLEGVMTIRACRAESKVIRSFDTFQDRRTTAEFLSMASNHAFSSWTELINIGFLALMTYLFILTKNDNTQESYVGLTLIQILMISEIIPNVVTSIIEIVSCMTSVERMLQFKELEPESSIENEPAVDIPSSWPHKGEIIFEHLYLRYSNENKPVLRDLNCRIESGSKIGIVGRTGAGKSSIVSALFRFAKFDGFLSIDGLDIKGIPLYELRSKLSVIPQEPVLFKTSLRKNLDPLGKFDESTLYSALESVELKSMFDSLDAPIERGGSNMSVGQRQLLCLARAIVNRNKILILDEATANIDSSTDALIQKTIRSEFKDCTVLTIAHRLNTVMDSDKILVMDDGRLVEFDHPFLLMQNKDSYLFKMAQQGGEAAIKNFINIAKQAAYSNLKTSDEILQNGEVEKIDTSKLS